MSPLQRWVYGSVGQQFTVWFCVTFFGGGVIGLIVRSRPIRILLGENVGRRH